MDAVTIRGVEILRPGKWNGVTFTLADLRAIVSAFVALKDELPPRIQLGHDEKQRLARELFGDDAAGADGFPALGWPDNLRVKGGRLLADLVDVPAKLARMIEKKVYRARSGGLLRNVVMANGATFPWVLDHVALLGDQAPAVPGLADMVLSRAGLTYEAAIGFSYAGADALALAAGDGVTDPEEQSELDGIMVELEALAERWGALVYGRRGAPAARTLWAEFAGRLKAVARQNLGADMANTVDLADVPAGTDPAADPAAAAGGGGLSFETPEQLAGWLAGFLGVSPGNLGAIADAVKKMKADEAIDTAAGETDPLAPDEGVTGMSKETAAADAVALARIDALAAKLAETQAAFAKSEIARQTAAAETRVDKDMAARNLPAALRATLVELASMPNDTLYLSVLEGAKPVPVGERGTAEDAVSLAAAVMTETDRKFAAANGINEADFLAEKARLNG